MSTKSKTVKDGSMKVEAKFPSGKKLCERERPMWRRA